MSFIEKLPSTYKSLKVQLRNTENEANGLRTELGDDEDYGYHECDCEYCPVPELPDLSPADIAEKTEKAEKLEELAQDYKVTIRRIEGYAKLVRVNLKDEVDI